LLAQHWNVMMRPTNGVAIVDRLEQLLYLFNAKSKRELVQMSRDLVVTQENLVSVILAAQMGVLGPYRYANRFLELTPPHLNPSKSEQEALGKSKVGEALTGEAKKMMSKIMATFRERRMFAAHLFYTRDRRHWYLFYFDQRDTSVRGNHWKGGPHIHLLTDFSNLDMEKVWAKVQVGETNFSQKLHLRYERRAEQTVK
jgi:hypothetical protein